MIIDKIVENTLRILDEKLHIVDVGISLSYTYCIVMGNRGLALGLAHTTYDKVFHGLKEELMLEITDIPRLIKSWKLLEKTLGLAMLNAVSQYILFNMGSNSVSNRMILGKDVLDVVNIPLDKNILVIGYIKPVIRKLREKGYNNIFVIEREPPTRFEDIYSDTMLPRIAETADIVFITGATLANDTLDSILYYTKKAKKILVGPSAQVLPHLLTSYGVDVVASVKVNNVWRVAEIVRRAGGTRAILKYSEKYVYMK